MTIQAAPFQCKARYDFSKILSSILLLAICLGITSLTGCQSDSNAQSNNFPMLTRKIGIIRSLGGAKTSNEGTHLLQTNNGDTILLKSNEIDLDDEKYNNKTVEVRGEWIELNSEQLFDVKNIDVLDE